MGMYAVREVGKENGMDVLRQIFKQQQATELQFVLFSTSGVHGSYSTIEDAERWLGKKKTKKVIDFYGDWGVGNAVTFLIVQPRIVSTVYGVCLPEGQEDIEFLKQLRQSSWDIVQRIGRDIMEV